MSSYLHTREAQFAPATINPERRTVELVWTTGAKVRRRELFGSVFDEELCLADGAVRLGRLNSGANVLDSHNAYGLRGIVGVVEKAWLTNGGAEREGRALVRFSDRDDVEPVWRDVQNGIVRNVSVGYAVHRTETVGNDAKVPLVRVVDWEPMELSLVAVPADAGAHARGSTMESNDTDTAGLPWEAPTSSSVVTAAGGALGERERIARISRACRTLGTPAALAERLIAEGVAADAAIDAMFEAASQRQQATRIMQIAPSFDDPEFRRNAMSDALASRISRTPPPEHAREWAHASLIDLARGCLEMHGIRAGRTPNEVWTRVAGLHTTSDFAILLADAQNKSLRKVYESAPSGIRPAARQTTASDFRAIHRLAAGNFPSPMRVLEHAEYTRGSFTESDEVYSLATYGRIFGISRQAIVNDDMGVFEGINRSAGLASAEFVSAQLADMVISNPAMYGDGTAIFHVNHGNLRSVSATIDVASVSAARVAMRSQKDLDGRNYLNASPRFLIVPPSLETAAEQFVSSIAATTTSAVNPFAGLLLVLVDPRLVSTAWYLAASPDAVDGLEFAFLDGNEGPQIETRIGFDIDGVETKLRLDFGAGWIDFRGWQKTPTA